MLSRQDNENISLMRSDNVHFWNERRLLLKPTFPWELVQIGNCGPPIETEAGWLVLSQGVGPMRRYSIGAFLLDSEQPHKVIGHMRHPIIEPYCQRAGRLCPECGVFLWRVVAPGPPADPIRSRRSCRRLRYRPLREVLGAMR